MNVGAAAMAAFSLSSGFVACRISLIATSSGVPRHLVRSRQQSPLSIEQRQTLGRRPLFHPSHGLIF